MTKISIGDLFLHKQTTADNYKDNRLYKLIGKNPDCENEYLIRLDVPSDYQMNMDVNIRTRHNNGIEFDSFSVEPNWFTVRGFEIV